MGARYEDSLLANLREKDELIVSLKRALTEKTKRQSELEQVIHLLGYDASILSCDDLGTNRQSRLATKGPAINAPDFLDKQHREEVLHFEATSGLYPDNWLKPKSSLALNDALVGVEIIFSFYLPEYPGWASKLMTLKPNFSDPTVLEIPRGRPVIYKCVVPTGFDVTPRLNLETVEEPRNENDLRDLGILLVSVVLGGQDVV